MPHNTPDATVSGSATLLRNEPVQARSAARLTRLLDSAAEVIDEIGYERLTTAMVAERAGASIGTVYRYFPDRIAVLQSLSARYRTEYIEEIQSVLATDSFENWLQAVDAVIDATVGVFASKPGYRSLRFGDVIDVRPIESDHTNAHIVASVLAASFVKRYELEDGEALLFHCEIAVQLIDSLLARAFTLDAKGDQKVIEETRTVVHRYLTSIYELPA